MDAKQLNCIENMVLFPDKTQKEIAQEIKVTEQTITAWKKSEEFQKALSDRLDEEWKSYRKEAQRLMVELARKGNYQAIQYILDSNGLKQPLEIKSDNTMTYKVEIDG